MTAATIDIRANASQAITEFDKLKARGSAALSGIKSDAENLQGTLGVLAGSAAAVAFTGMVKGAIDAGDSLNKLTQRTGIATDTLSQWQYAADLADVSTEEFSKGIKQLNDNIAKGLAGDKEKVAMFKQLGVQLRDVNGQARNTEAVLLDVADAFQKHADGAGKVATANDLMGRAGEKMIPLLNGGSAAIQQMKDEATALGIVISADFAQQAEQFNDSITKMHQGSKALGLQIASEALPTLQRLVDELNNTNKSAADAGESFGQKLGGGIRNAMEASAVFGSEILFTLKAIGTEIGGIAAQGAAVLRGDFKGAYALHGEMVADAEQRAKDQQSRVARLMGKPDPNAPAYTGPGAGYDDSDARGTAKPQMAVASRASTEKTEYQKLIEKVKERIALGDAELQKGGELNEYEKFRAKILEDVNAAGAKLSATERQSITDKLDQAKATQQQLDVQRSAYKDALEKSTEAQKRREQEAEEAKKLNLQIMQEDSARYKSAREMLESIEFETQLLGLNTQERERAVVVREMERAGIKEGTKAWEDYAEKIKAATDKKLEKSRVVEAAQAAAGEWRSITNDLYSGVTDSLRRGFEAGRGFFRTFWDGIKQTLRGTIIQVGVQLVGGGSTGWLGTALGQNPATNGGGGIMGMANSAQSAYSLYSNGSAAYTVGSQWAAGTMSGANAAGTIYANATGAGIDGLLATNGAYGTAAATTATGTGAAVGGAAVAEGAGTAVAAGEGAGATGALASMGPYGWAALAVMAIIASGAFSGGETRMGGQYNGTGLVAAPSGGEINGPATQQAIKATQESINAAIKSLGGSVQLQGFTSGLESSENGKGFAYAGGRLSDGTVFGQGTDGQGYNNRRGSKSAEEAAAEFAEELQQATLQALQKSDIKGALANYIRGLGNIDALGGAELQTAYNRVQKALGERATLEKRLADMTAATTSAEEKLTAARAAERAQVDETNQRLLDEVYARQDLADAGAQLIDAAQREANDSTKGIGALQQAAKAQRDYAKSLRDFAQSLVLGESSPVGVLAKLGLARYQFDSTASAAMSGDEDARNRLQGASSEYLSASMNSAGSFAEYQATFATVQAVLGANAAAAESQASNDELQLQALQQQLDVAHKQLEALGLVNTNLLTFAQALENFNAKKAAVDAAVAAKDAENNAPLDPLRINPFSGLAHDTAGAKGAIGGALHKAWAGAAAQWEAANPPSGFADGGEHAGGLRLVGEEGPELEVTGPSRIYSARQTRELLAGDNSDGGAATEVRALRAQAAGQQRALEAIAHRLTVMGLDLHEMRIRGVQILPAENGDVPTVKTVAA